MAPASRHHGRERGSGALQLLQPPRCVRSQQPERLLRVRELLTRDKERGGGRKNDVIVSETHRTYSDASGYERLGLARTLGRQGRSITRERFSSGEERSSQAFSSLDAGRAEDFDERWQQTATSSELDRISFLKGSSTRRQLRDQASTRQPRAPSQEEREIARQGRRVFNQHTERIVRQAREIGSGGSSTTTRRGQGRQPSAPRRAASNQDEAEALRWARQETQNLWN